MFQKRCIVERTEIAIARLYDADKVLGLYPSDPPVVRPRGPVRTWVQNIGFWEKLVKEMDFPVAKVKMSDMIAHVTDERLSRCTRFMDRGFLRDYNYTGTAMATAL